MRDEQQHELAEAIRNLICAGMCADTPEGQRQFSEAAKEAEKTLAKHDAQDHR